MDGRTPAASAAQEAWEEAGVRGRAGDQCLGLYSYQQWRGGAVPLLITVMVYPVAGAELVDVFPEQNQRLRKWFARSQGCQQCARAGFGPHFAGVLPGSAPKGAALHLILLESGL